MSLDGLEKLNVWRKAKDFALLIYREALPALPKEEKWALDQQLRRAAVSISANIAEGHGRYYYQDNVRFCYIARGSLEEVVSLLAVAYEMDFLPQERYDALIEAGAEVNRLINGYIRFLKKSKRGENEPGAQVMVKESPALYDLDLEEDSE